MTREEYELEVLRSAEPDGTLHPPQLTDKWARLAILTEMYMRGEIDRAGEGPMVERTGPYCIAPAGRERISSSNAAFSRPPLGDE